MMNRHIAPPDLKRDYHTSREFLLNIPVVPANRIQRHPPTTDQRHQLQTAFAGMKAGQALVDDWVRGVSAQSPFGALAMRIDPDETGQAVEDERLIFLAGVLNAAATEINGCWGLIYQGIMGFFMPGEAESDYTAMAAKIRSDFGHNRGDCLSIGIAGYPCHHFTKERILDNAVKALDHATFLGPDTTVRFDSVSLNISGDRLYAQGNLEESINEFEHAIRLDPSNMNARNSLGVCYGVLKQYPKALSEFQAAISSAPGEVMAIYNFGLVKLLTGHPHEALDCFLQAEGIRNDIFEVAFHIGKLYVQLDQPEKGLTYLKKAEQLNSKTAGVYRLMGHCHTRLDDHHEAIAAYSQALRINPGDAQALSDLGHQYDLHDENLEIATLFCERSTQIEPENGLFHHRLGRLYLKAEKLSQALAAFEKAEALGYDSNSSIQHVSEILTGPQNEVG